MSTQYFGMMLLRGNGVSCVAGLEDILLHIANLYKSKMSELGLEIASYFRCLKIQRCYKS